MIGVVIADLKAAVHLVVLNAEGESKENEVFVDTGFNGELSLSPAVIAQADFSLVDEVEVQLADGSIVLLPIFSGEVLWNSQTRKITVLSTKGDAVLGMRLLENHELKIEVRTGGAVTIESLN